MEVLRGSWGGPGLYGGKSAHLGRSWDFGCVLEVFEGILGGSWALLGKVLAAFFAILGRLGGVLEPPKPILDGSWAHLGAKGSASPGDSFFWTPSWHPKWKPKLNKIEVKKRSFFANVFKHIFQRFFIMLLTLKSALFPTFFAVGSKMPV